MTSDDWFGKELVHTNSVCLLNKGVVSVSRTTYDVRLGRVMLIQHRAHLYSCVWTIHAWHRVVQQDDFVHGELLIVCTLLNPVLNLGECLVPTQGKVRQDFRFLEDCL